MKVVYVGALVIMAVMGSTVTNAQSLKDKEYMAREEKDLADDVQSTNQKCGIGITAKFNWPTPLKPEDHKYSASSFCMDVLWAVREVCQSSPAGKEAVTQQIKSLSCGFAAKRSLALKDGVLDYKIEWEATNNPYYALEYLKNNL